MWFFFIVQYISFLIKYIKAKEMFRANMNIKWSDCIWSESGRKKAENNTNITHNKNCNSIHYANLFYSIWLSQVTETCHTVFMFDNNQVHTLYIINSAGNEKKTFLQPCYSTFSPIQFVHIASKIAHTLKTIFIHHNNSNEKNETNMVKTTIEFHENNNKRSERNNCALCVVVWWWCDVSKPNKNHKYNRTQWNSAFCKLLSKIWYEIVLNRFTIEWKFAKNQIKSPVFSNTRFHMYTIHMHDMFLYEFYKSRIENKKETEKKILDKKIHYGNVLNCLT